MLLGKILYFSVKGMHTTWYKEVEKQREEMEDNC